MRMLRVRLERLTHWLLGTRVEVAAPIATQLMNGLFVSVPIFIGGVLNTVVVATIAVARHPAPPFIAWLVFEIVLGALRLGVLIGGRRRIGAGQTPPRLCAAMLSCAWSASVGWGTFLCLTSGDWVLATIACLSAAAMVCGICLRNFGTPRLAALMVFSILAPCALAGLMAGEAVMVVISVQLPIFMLTIFSASTSLHRMLVSRMTALINLQRSESLTSTILRASPDYTLIVDEDFHITYCKRPNGLEALPDPLIGEHVSLAMPPEHCVAGMRMLENARAGTVGNLLTYHVGADGEKRWFDVIASPITDGSGRLIIVARDITHQKHSEEQAVWMARHDALTGLPNRSLLQDRLDRVLEAAGETITGALLIVDVDNFKSVNDTLGHDGGDALLCTFATRLRAAVSGGDLVARTGGDEFALLVNARSDAEVKAVAARIFEQLREPFSHAGRMLECRASIGASLIPRDGAVRSDIMKAADVALYAAKALGRAQLKLFEPAMMVEVERHQGMIASARYALQRDTVVPYYQPKVSFRSSRIVGFEALLRWRDRDGALCGPDGLQAAFEDPALGNLLSDRMLERVLDDVQRWVRAGIDFGHVAINVAAADFRRADFADNILSQLERRAIACSHIQIEVTETVFLGQGAGDVEDALRRLSDRGIRIALDDFGTGYASLSHLNQFPVDLLKIDRSFIERIGTSPDAEAISATVINLGHCLGLEVIAEGVETAAQEADLIAMGCDTGQGFLYSCALPAQDVPDSLCRQDAVGGQQLRA